MAVSKKDLQDELVIFDWNLPSVTIRTECFKGSGDACDLGEWKVYRTQRTLTLDFETGR